MTMGDFVKLLDPQLFLCVLGHLHCGGVSEKSGRKYH